jgi:hypothetical protein
MNYITFLEDKGKWKHPWFNSNKSLIEIAASSLEFFIAGFTGCNTHWHDQMPIPFEVAS